MAKVVGGLVHRGDATAAMSNGKPGGKYRGKSDGGMGSKGVMYMKDPVKAANAKLRKGK